MRYPGHLSRTLPGSLTRRFGRARYNGKKQGKGTAWQAYNLTKLVTEYVNTTEIHHQSKKKEKQPIFGKILVSS